MSNYEGENGGNCGFRWGKKIGEGKGKGKWPIYESFTYYDTEYLLYDSVYLYKEGEQELYIGKLVKMWEQPGAKKVIKVVWFFRPSEIINWLGDDAALENEIFLACGEGVGLYNINPLEAICGKCNVICTSKDTRNRQPSDKEVRMADYIFYRTFNVKNYTISEHIEDEIAGIEVEYFFNHKSYQNPHGVSGVTDLENDEEKMDKAGDASCSFYNINLQRVQTVLTKSKKPSCHSSPTYQGGSEQSLELAQGKRFQKASNSCNLGNDCSNSQRNGNQCKELAHDKGLWRASESHIFGSEHKTKTTTFKESLLHDKSPFKKFKLDEKVTKPSVEVPKFSEESSHEKGFRKVPEIYDFGSKDETILTSKESMLHHKGHLSESECDEKVAKSSFTLVLKDGSTSVGKSIKINGQKSDLTRRPTVDKSKWFKSFSQSWDERIQSGYKQGTILILENLDPDYTSTEIQDIIWQGFNEECHAKVIKRTGFSSPHSGAAAVIFGSKEAADIALEKLDNECLMLPNGRALVGHRGTPRVIEEPTKFYGHLFINTAKLCMREEMRQEAATSHCSQPNTIEYEMAIDWKLIQAKSEGCWEELYKVLGDEFAHSSEVIWFYSLNVTGQIGGMIFKKLQKIVLGLLFYYLWPYFDGVNTIPFQNIKSPYLHGKVRNWKHFECS